MPFYQFFSDSNKVSVAIAGQTEISVDEYHLIDLMDMLVHDMHETGTPPTVSEKFSACYDRLKKGKSTLPVADVVAILPELFTHLEYLECILNLKAPRPDAPAVTATNAIVGKDTCDLTQVMSGLRFIKKQITNLQKILCEKIDDIDKDLFDTKTILCSKFDQTWTILDNLSVSATCDLSGVFSVLDNLTVSATVDLSGVFSVLADIDQDIFDTKTILCDKFEQTWTILDDIDSDLLDTKTILCAKFDGTFTVLDGIETDLNEIFTVLDDIDQDIFDTKTILCNKFDQTWTILQEILQAGCPATPLDSDDIVGGVIALNTEGINYSLCENVTADIIITGSNVTLDLNDRVVTGTINISSSDVIVKDGKIKPPAPVSLAAANPGVTVTNASKNTRILNLFRYSW